MAFNNPPPGREEDDEEDDELYGGFNDGTPLTYTTTMQTRAQGAPPPTGGFGYPPGAATRGLGGGAPPPSRFGAPPPATGAVPEDEGPVRPMTSIKAAGFSSRDDGRGFDPLKQGNKGPAPALQKKSESSPEEEMREFEKKINHLIDESAILQQKGQLAAALDKAKEAMRKERQLCKQREQHNLVDMINIDLTYSVCFNLANQYHANKMYQEALSTYNLIVKNKQYAQSGRLRVNMGNVFFEQKKYPQAIKMYRMALDQVPNTHSKARFKIMKNIAVAFIKIGQYQDAKQTLENIMDGSPDLESGYNLVIAYYALGDIEKMKLSFERMIALKDPGMERDEDLEEELTQTAEEDDGLNALLSDDPLTTYLREKREKCTDKIIRAAKLIAPKLDKKNFEKGYDFVVEALRKEGFNAIANELDIARAMTYLKKKDFKKSIETLKSFEKKDVNLAARAATNLSFIYFLESDFPHSEYYADLAIRADRYNAKALVNKGNCLIVKGEYERSREMYMEAIGVEANCLEAIYNVGLVNKRLRYFEDALHAFEKLHSMVPSAPEVLYQIASLHEVMGDFQKALKWYNLFCSRVPTDPGILARMGALQSKDEDEAGAFHYHQESYRYYPVDMDVISWLGAYFVKNEIYEKAMSYFQRASEIQPHEVKWQLMIASCHRRIGAYQDALNLYRSIHKKHPDNLECEYMDCPWPAFCVSHLCPPTPPSINMQA
uniref:Intraflagellar transport protein 88 n=1 Tax=Palpitomonas bilix TaxID=652834 RepID=A0A7S3GJA5_9EUKA|mmetsp:Transcript_5999/g.14574  ORF Transcript_5999/g.14574 Transcript_5999/m.14574 type:complete len:719 (+) Transcript_5999:133-2289(+)